MGKRHENNTRWKKIDPAKEGKEITQIKSKISREYKIPKAQVHNNKLR